MVSPSKGVSHPDLEGAQGREVLFRPHRYNVKELIGDLPMHIRYRDFDGRLVVCDIVNLSTNGLAFRASTHEALRNGESLPEFQILWGEDVLYQGQASVTNQREHEGTLLVGCSLKSGSLDTETLQGLKEKARARSQIKVFQQEFQALYQSEIPLAYKGLIADFRLLMERYQQILRDQEHDYKGLSKHRNSWERHVLEYVEPDFSAHFRDLVQKLFEQIRHLSGEERNPFRDYAQYHLHHLMMLAPVLHRSYHKPLGYAGDYQVLVWIYSPENHYEGDTLFGKLLHRMACTTTASLAGIERIPFLTHKIREQLEQHQANHPFRLFSLASGPAKEIQDLLQNHPPRIPLHITLFDQDAEALSYAHELLSPLEAKCSEYVQIQYLHSSVKQLIQGAEFIKDFPKQDMITSTGLFDYLPKRVASQLLTNLVSILAPDGTAYIGNFKVNDTQFIFEYLCDWDLIYRTEQDLMDLTANVPVPVDYRVECEKTGTNLFLVAKKKGSLNESVA